MMKNKENRLVVADAGWAKTTPEWLLQEVKTERMIYGLASLMGEGKSKVGDAELAVYLYTLSLRQPLSREYTHIYLYLCTKLMAKREKEVPEEIKVEELTEDEPRLLNELREEIYKARGGEIKHPLLDAMRELKKEIK